MKKPFHFDIIIIGSGIGGLVAGTLLAKEGYTVKIFEKNKQFGGALQTFAFEKEVFDSCVHYFGSMFPGESQYKLFKYLEIYDEVEWEFYDKKAFDIIQWENEKKYALPQGVEAAKKYLSDNFPEEKESLITYFDLLNKTVESFPLYQLRAGEEEEKSWVQDWNMMDTLNRLFKNKDLIKLLIGNAFLYNGQVKITPFYEHALIIYSYFSGTVKAKKGSSQITRALLKTFYKYGGRAMKNTLIDSIIVADNVNYIVKNDDKEFYAKTIIFNGNLKQFPSLFQKGMLPNRWIRRLQEAETSMTCFMAHIVVEKKKIPYKKTNYYWNAAESYGVPLDSVDLWPFNMGVYWTEDRINKGWVSSLTILSYMNKEVFSGFKLKDIIAEKDFSKIIRNAEYEEVKESYGNKLISLFQKKFPEYKSFILNYQFASPVTLNKYLNYPEGAMYGIMKDSDFLLKNTFLAKSPLDNIWLTGQDVGMHGVLGVSIHALLTTLQILSKEKADALLGKINA